MDVELTQPAEASVLKLEGSWTIERANELKRVLLGILNRCERMIIDLDGITDLDLSTVQLFCSAHRTSLRNGKDLALHERKSQRLKQVVRDAGFVRTLGCHKDPHKSCLWIGGWNP
ncbi:MAG: lipid asymmetry maintenance protein MlaB [Syntrophobacteraceae bacterium]